MDQAEADVSAAETRPIKTASVGVQPRDVEALLGFPGLHDTHSAKSNKPGPESRQPGWLEQFSDEILPALR